MVYVTILLSIICIILILLLFCVFKEVKHITSSLKEIMNSSSNQRIRLNLSFKPLRLLTMTINELLIKMKKTEIQYKHIDNELREAIANVSHDLRTPLTSIKGYIELIEAKNIEDKTISNYLEIVNSRCEALQCVLESLYDLSRLESNEYNFNIISVNPYNFLCSVLAGFYDDFKKNNIEPSVNLDPNCGEILADGNALTRIYINLVQNAIKHGENQVSVKLYSEDCYIITEFSNDSSALKEEDIPYLFDRFFTSDKNRTNKNTGLGLYIAKSFVEHMDGTITASFEKNVLTFFIRWKKTN